MDSSAQDYKSILTDIIKKQIVILGPAITLAKVRQVKGLSVTDDGTVTGADHPESINKQLLDQFSELSAPMVKKTMAALMPQSNNPTPPQPVDEEETSDTQQATSDTETSNVQQQETSDMQHVTSDTEQESTNTQEETNNEQHDTN